MSLADQSQQWYPTSAQVTVLQARSLRIKGKHGTNDAYAIMQVAKEKFSTAVAEKSVAPVWKEEATFDLPLFHHGNTERCTLNVLVMHRALVGPDKLLGQAVINLLELNEVKSRNKTEWFKLLDKAGKPDKERGEVLLDIQFMKNNLTASMFDLSAANKPRSRLGKFKDKVRGKKKEGLSDSASAVVPSLTQVMTDSEGEGDGDAEGGANKGEKKKKHKLKSLFSPKSNLQRNISQSMSVLGPLPEKNSSLTGSRSSGLNEDSSEGKKKFKFLTHKRTGSSDSKGSQGPLSMLGRSKGPAPAAEQSNMCINGSHVYTEEPQPRSSRAGSNFSLASSGHGSMEDLRRAQGRKSSDTSMDSLRALKQPSPWAEKESSRPDEEVDGEEEDEEEERVRMEEERKRKEEQLRRKLEEEEKMRNEEQEKSRVEVEKKRIEEEERIWKEEQATKRIEEREKMRIEEEERKRKLEEDEEVQRQEEDDKSKREEERVRMEEDVRLRKEEEERRMREEGEQVMREENRLRKEEEERKMREEEEQRRMREEEKQVRREENRLRKEEEERKMSEEEEQRRMREEEEQVRGEENRLRKEEEERKMREEEEKRKMREEEEQVIREENRLRKEEEERKMREERREEERMMREEEEKRKMREEEEHVIREENRLRKEEEERKMREEEEQVRREENRLRKEEEERRMREERREEERMKREEEEEDERLRKEEKRREEEERMRWEEEEEQDRLRKAEEDRKVREEERLRREEEIMRQKEEEEKRRKERERIKLEEEMMRKEEHERMSGEEERRKREEEEEERKMEEEEEKKREEEEERKREEEEEERKRVEEQRRKLMEEHERARLDDEKRRKEEERRQQEIKMMEEENNTIEEEKGYEQERVTLTDVEKQMEQKIEGEALMDNDPFEEVPSTNPFDGDITSTNPFEETSSASPPGPLSRAAKVSAVKPSSSSYAIPSLPIISSNPILLPSGLESSMESPRGPTNPAQDLPTDLIEKKRLAPLPPNNQRPSKPDPPPRRHSETLLVGSRDDHQLKESMGSGGQQHHSGSRDKRRPAPQPPGSLREKHGAQNQTHADLGMTRVNLGQREEDRQGRDKHASISNVFSQRLVQIFTPLRSSATAQMEHTSDVIVRSNPYDSQSEEAVVSATDELKVAKHNKGQAPSKPHSSLLGGKTMPKPEVDDPKHIEKHSMAEPTVLVSRERSTSDPKVKDLNILDKHCSVKELRQVFASEKRMDEDNLSSKEDPAVFEPNPFAEDDIRENKSSDRRSGDNKESLESIPDDHHSCPLRHADPGLLQERGACDTQDLPVTGVLAAEDGTKSISIKRVRAPLPPVKIQATSREQGADDQCSMNVQSTRYLTSGVTSSIPEKRQNRMSDMALPCNTITQPLRVSPSPTPSSVSHPEPLKESKGKKNVHPRLEPAGQRTLLQHAGSLTSEAQPSAAQFSGEEAGGKRDRPASTTRRPHPVKPLSSLENQPASDIQEGQGGKSAAAPGGLQETFKVNEARGQGPYSQLTQEELIALVVKQQGQLSKKNSKIVELEQYIDNLLVRVIEEKPSILMSLNSLKRDL